MYVRNKIFGKKKVVVPVWKGHQTTGICFQLTKANFKLAFTVTGSELPWVLYQVFTFPLFSKDSLVYSFIMSMIEIWVLFLNVQRMH